MAMKRKCLQAHYYRELVGGINPNRLLARLEFKADAPRCGLAEWRGKWIRECGSF